MNIKRDGHIHTPFCPHGSLDSMESYVKKAIEIGLEEISFTEHAPLPDSFQDPAPTKDSSMKIEDVPRYIENGKKIKENYAKQIKINIGFEVDFIAKYQEDTREFLEKWGKDIDDAILSVHMIPINDEYICMDYSAEEFGRLVKEAGSVKNVYDRYFQQVEDSILADLGQYKPNRIGHISLVQKFQKKFPVPGDFTDTILHLLNKIKEQNMELDANSAGWYKPDCLESYPPLDYIRKASQMNISIVPGSDSHQAKDLARGFNHFLF